MLQRSNNNRERQTNGIETFLPEKEREPSLNRLSE